MIENFSVPHQTLYNRYLLIVKFLCQRALLFHPLTVTCPINGSTAARIKFHPSLSGHIHETNSNEVTNNGRPTNYPKTVPNSSNWRLHGTLELLVSDYKLISREHSDKLCIKGRHQSSSTEIESRSGSLGTRFTFCGSCKHQGYFLGISSNLNPSIPVVDDHPSLVWLWI